jgi:glycosyltransferase involved in cell wall biosynthesis
VNICLISTGFPPDNGGGIGTYIYNLSKGLIKLGHEVHVISPTAGKGYHQDIIDGIVVHRLPKKTLPKIERFFPGLCWSFQVYRLIRSLHKTKNFDIVEFPNWEAPGVFTQFLLDIPVVVRLHTPFFETLGLDSDTVNFADKVVCSLEKLSCKKAKQLVSSTRSHAKTITDEYKISVEDIHILPLGIIDKSSGEIIERTEGEITNLLYVSRLENRKGTLALLEALSLLNQKNKKFHIDIIGSDRSHAPGAIKFKQYFELNYTELNENVSFHGFVDDETLDHFYRQADLFVVPSVYESFGLIYVEAMMYSLPSIATFGGGIPEVISNGIDGFLTEINDSEAIADKILMLINDKGLLEVMGNDARQSFENKFEYLIMAKNTETLYQHVTSI